MPSKTRILSEEPDPWESVPKMPERTQRVPHLEQTEIYRKGDVGVDAEQIRYSREILVREQFVNMATRLEYANRARWCVFKYPVSWMRKCDYIIQQFLSQSYNQQFHSGPPPKLDRQMYEDIFYDNDRIPDLYNTYGQRDTGPLSGMQEENGDDE